MTTPPTAVPAAAATETAAAVAAAPLVSVLMPTYRRPTLLPKALASLMRQTGLAARTFEIIVVDNCPDASAQAVVSAFVAGLDADRAAAVDPPVRYLHEPRPGISHPRNRALAAARGRFVLFLDDDQESAPGLIAAFLAAQRATEAAALFGPVEANLEAGADGSPPADADTAAYFSRRYAVADLADITDDSARLGTSNSFFDRDRCFPEAEPFNPALGMVGGEDTLVFRAMKARGIRFRWVAAALSIEFVPRQRQSRRYMRMRRFRSGQITVLTCLRLRPRRIPEAALWMAVGLAQALAYAGLAAMMWLLGRRRWAHFAARAWGGAGKVLWMERFRFPAYGAQARLSRG